MARFIVEHNGFTHAGRGDADDIQRRDLGGCLMDAVKYDFPVRIPVKFHGTGDPWFFHMGPLSLSSGKLLPGFIKYDRFSAAGARVKR
jgi:hypothetical protein